MTVSRALERGGAERVGGANRVAALTGIRAVAALLVVATHAAYTTGKYPRGYVGLVYSRLEIGVPIFFVLSGFLLFRPWVKSAMTGGPPPSLRRYARHRVRRIMPAYVVTVLAAYLLYHFRTAGPNPGHTWIGLLRNLTLTQLYTDGYNYAYLHQGLTQMWSLAVEVSFYVALPALAYLLLVWVCRRSWRPWLLLTAIGALGLVSPAWLVLVHNTDLLPDGARLWLPTYLLWFLAGMALTVLQVLGVRCYGFVVLPVAVVSFLVAATPIAGEPTTSPTGLAQAIVKTVFYAVVAALLLAPAALGDDGWYTRFLGSRPMVWLGEISYEIFLVHLVLMEIAMTEVLHKQVYTGSMPVLFGATMALTIPVAWLLHRFTRVRSE
ncbi:MAG: acyltransferase [Mycobacterium sp.]|nr:acyltransferase [Mycobacterium sp.]HNM83430.1 acyltransferase [Mycobacterium sp.]